MIPRKTLISRQKRDENDVSFKQLNRLIVAPTLGLTAFAKKNASRNFNLKDVELKRTYGNNSVNSLHKS